MAKALGIGGVFFKSKNQSDLVAWYAEVLGVTFEHGFTSFKPDSMPKFGQSVFCVFEDQTKYLGAPEQQFMINFVVDDVRAMIAKIIEAGGTQVDDFVEESYGTFAWFNDPDGNKVELWQPMSEC